MADRMPYFRCYADTWRVRLQDLTLQAQLFVMHALLTCWGDERGGARKLPAATWARKVSLGVDGLDELIGNELATCSWIQIKSEEDMVTVVFPELQDQASEVDAAAQRKRTSRARRGAGQHRDRPRDNAVTGSVTIAGQARDTSRDKPVTAPGQVPGQPRDPLSIDLSIERTKRGRERSIDRPIEEEQERTGEPAAGSAGLGPAGVVSPKTQDPTPSELPAARPVPPPLKAPRWIPAASQWLPPGKHPTFRGATLDFAIGEFGGYGEWLANEFRICEFTAAEGRAFRLLWEENPKPALRRVED